MKFVKTKFLHQQRMYFYIFMILLRIYIRTQKCVIKYLFSALSKVSYLQGICKLQFERTGLMIASL